MTIEYRFCLPEKSGGRGESSPARRGVFDLVKWPGWEIDTEICGGGEKMCRK